MGGALGALYSGYSWNTLGPAWTFAIASLVVLIAAFITYTRISDEQPTSCIADRVTDNTRA